MNGKFLVERLNERFLAELTDRGVIIISIEILRETGLMPEKSLPGLRNAGIMGLGICLPERRLTNQDLERMVDTSDEWIQERTGICERRIAARDEAVSDLATVAARRALEDSGLSPEDIDLVMVATVMPDHYFPSSACLVQARLGAARAAAVDIEAACSGFVYALAMGSQFVMTGFYRHVLVIGAETLSKLLDYQDRTTCVIMADGAGAAVLGPVGPGEGILSTVLGADGNGADLLKVPAGGSRLPSSQETVAGRLHYIQMEGREVFKFAVKAMAEAATQALAACGLTLADVDFCVPHQANYRIIEALARRFDLSMERIMVNIDRYGNTSSASIPIALAEARSQGRFSKGDLILLVAFGGGLTWGATVLRWT